jgi:Glyoxalase-like domain
LLPADGDQPATVEALISLGAARFDARDGGTVVLAEPDGNECCVRPAAVVA